MQGPRDIIRTFDSSDNGAMIVELKRNGTKAGDPPKTFVHRRRERHTCQ